MKISRTFGLILALGALACQKPAPDSTESPEAPPFAALTVEGRVLTTAGEAPALAHVHLWPQGADEPTETVEAGADGTFRLNVPGGALYELVATAVNHQGVAMALVTEGAAELELEVSLAPNPFLEDFEDLRIFGDWNDWDYGGGPEMERRGDGTWSYMVEGAGEQVAYQLIGATTNGRSVNGLRSDAYEYDGAGDYKSIIATTDGRVEIVFDPAQAPRGSRERADIKASDPTVSGVFELGLLIAGARIAHREAGGSEERIEEFYSLVRNAVLAALEETSKPALGAYAASQLLDLGKAFSAEQRNAAARRIPADSPLWSLAGGAVSKIDATVNLGVLEALRQEHPSTEVRALALAALVRQAKTEQDEPRWRELYAELQGYESVSSQVRSMLAELDPNLRIDVGRPVPAFSVALLDPDPAGPSTVSSESLLGTYYLVDFWATWCAPCIAEMPKLHEAVEKYGSNTFQILSVSVDDTVEEVREFRAGEWKMPWLHVYLENGFDHGMTQAFEVERIPKPVLIDPEGNILATPETLRGEDLLETLEKAIGR